MTATCPTCSWPTPTPVSTHGTIRYLRCVCGKWLIEERGAVLATAGHSTLSDPQLPGDEPSRLSTPGRS
ncbi:hypothetical protein HLB23_20875 [Nocardia uniformis]|uniref:Uncharacterized protein n=1 Tax=Nocardia uniformis TaxID=53432 RepID=A0A849C0I5_9NOCA|nr:hypothetical protein [Nocardia uniformis]NNH72283.1 hypothetical protein [Nocardia uniformis]